MITNDAKLLRRYADTKDESAFSELVSRNIDLVWSTAFRACRNADLAQDISQEVFADLAKKARSLSSNRNLILAGWLYRATRYASSIALRGQLRRTKREQEAFMMQETLKPIGDTNEQTEAILPEVENAFDKLNSRDRDAVILRFFQRKSLQDVGNELGISERAAQKRISRSLEKLRSHLERKGIKTASGSLAVVLTGISAQAAPAGIVTAITTSSIAAAETFGAASGILGTIATLKTQAVLMKTQIAVGTLATAVVVTPLAVQQSKLNDLREENQNLQTVAAQLDDLEAENRRLNRIRLDAEELERRRADQQELIALRAEVASLSQQEITEKLALRDELEAAQSAASESKYDREATLSIEGMKQTVSDLEQLSNKLMGFAFNHDGRYPTYDEYVNEIQDFIPDGIELDRYEFIRHPTIPNREGPRVILFRQTIPRQLPTGSWSRGYLLSDGMTANRLSEDGNWDDVELELIKPDEPTR